METYIIILKILFWISCIVCVLYAIFGKIEVPYEDKGFSEGNVSNNKDNGSNKLKRGEVYDIITKDCTYIHDNGANPCIKADFECYLCKHWK